MAGTHIDEARQTTLLQVLAAVTGQTDLRTQQSEAGAVEQDDYLQFYVSIFSISTGAISSADIDITGMTAVLSQSRAGAAFNAAGITQPIFTKANGKVSCAYKFLLAEWEMGDVYRLVLSGIKTTVGGDVVFVQDMVWSNIVVESADLETIVNTINTVQGAEADAATLDDLSDVTTTTTEAKLRRLLLRLAPGAYSATINGVAQTDEAAALAALATYFKTAGAAIDPTINGASPKDISSCFLDIATYLKAAGAAYSATIGGAAKADVESSFTQLAAYFNAASAAISVTIDNGGAARSNLNDILSDLGAILNGGGITTFPASAAPGNGVNIAAVLGKIYDLVAEGTVFKVKKTILQSDIVAAGIDLTLASTGGELELIAVYTQNGAVAFDSAAHGATAELFTNNVSGSLSFMTAAQALLIANCIVSDKNATSWTGVVLETGKKVSIKATGENFTSAGNADIYLIFRRLAPGATVAAA